MGLVLKKAFVFIKIYMYILLHINILIYIFVCEIPFSVKFREGIEILVTFIIIISTL